MRTTRLAGAAAAAAITILLPTVPAGAAPLTPGGSTEVTVGSNDPLFSQNKQNEPGLAVNPVQAQHPGRGRQRQHRPGGVQRRRRPHVPVHPGRRRVGRPVLDRLRPDLDPADLHRLLGAGRAELPRTAGRGARPAAGRRHRLRAGPGGPIGTLPNYFENGMVSNGDPELVFGPVPDAAGDFSWANGQRLYYANIATNFPGGPGFPGAAPSPCRAPTTSPAPSPVTTTPGWTRWS